MLHRLGLTWIGFLLAVFVLCGRWGLSRLYVEDLANLPTNEHEFSLLQLRTIVVPALAIIVLIHPSSRRSEKIHRGFNQVVTAIFGLFGYLLLTSLWAPNGGLAIAKATDIALIAVACASVVCVVKKGLGPAVFREFWVWLFVLTGLIAVIALSVAISSGGAELRVLGGGPNVFGRMMGMLCVSSLYLISRRLRTVFVVGVVVAVLLVVLSGSRGSLLALALAVVAFAIVDRLRISTWLPLGLCALPIFTFLLFATEIGESATSRFQSRIVELTVQARHSAGREGIFSDAIDVGLEHPWFGAGLAAFKAQEGTYPHNLVLELFSEGGGTGVVMGGLIVFLAAGMACRHFCTLESAAVGGLVLILVASQVSGDFYDSRAFFVYVIMAYVPKFQSALHPSRATIDGGATWTAPLSVGPKSERD